MHTLNKTLQWGEFSLAELNNFMKVLEREEAGHEFYIRQKYQHLGEVLKLAIRAGDKPVVESHNRIVKIPQ